jgi:hypothetical protein
MSIQKRKRWIHTHFVALDKITKWIEAKLVASITSFKAMEFIYEIMYRFGDPNNIITDSRTQFNVREFRDFYENARINVNYASISHPQSNREV